MNNSKLLDIFDQLVVFSMTIMLIMAFFYQFAVHDLPCSMCMMSRMGLYAISFGFIINLTKGRSSSNYFLSLIACLVSLAISLEFLVRHIVPGSSTFGSAVFGLHMYTWNFIATFLIMLYCAIAGIILNNKNTAIRKINFITKLIIAILMLTLITNAVSTFIECGLYTCPSDPTSYWLIDVITH